MKIKVSVKPNAKQSKVEAIAEGHYSVSVKASPQEGKANKAVAAALAAYFDVPKSHVELIRGAKSKLKVFEVPV